MTYKNKEGFANVFLMILLLCAALAVGYYIGTHGVPDELTPSEIGTSTGVAPGPGAQPQTSIPVQPIQNPNPIPVSTSTPAATSTAPIPKKSGINGNVVSHYCNGTQPANPPAGYQPCTQGPLASFKVMVKSNTSGASQQLITDSVGKFQVELPVGFYIVTGEPYQGIASKAFTVQVKQGLFTNFEMKFEEVRQ